MSGIKKVLLFTLTVFVLALAYFIYAYNVYPPVAERETYLAEIGEGFGEAGLWALLFIYARTLLKVMLGKGAIARRLLPDYSPDINLPVLRPVLGFLDRTHVYVGIFTLAILLLHIFLMGIPFDILFFPAVLGLLIWQGLFGLFIAWRFTPKQLRKFSYLVHAQLVTGIMIGVFAWFGHLLID